MCARRMLANAAAILAPIAVPWVWRKLFPRSTRGIAVVELFVCSAYCPNSFLLWYGCTSKDTKIVSGRTLVLSIKLIKSVVSLGCDFCCCVIGWGSSSTKSFRRAFAASIDWFPDWIWFVDVCEGLNNWDSWRVASLGEPFFRHVVNEFIFVELHYTLLLNSLQCFFCHWFF